MRKENLDLEIVGLAVKRENIKYTRSISVHLIKIVCVTFLRKVVS